MICDTCQEEYIDEICRDLATIAGKVNLVLADNNTQSIKEELESVYNQLVDIVLENYSDPNGIYINGM